MKTISSQLKTQVNGPTLMRVGGKITTSTKASEKINAALILYSLGAIKRMSYSLKKFIDQKKLKKSL